MTGKEGRSGRSADLAQTRFRPSASTWPLLALSDTIRALRQRSTAQGRHLESGRPFRRRRAQSPGSWMTSGSRKVMARRHAAPARRSSAAHQNACFQESLRRSAETTGAAAVDFAGFAAIF